MCMCINIGVLKPNPDNEPDNLSGHRVIGSTTDKLQVNKINQFCYIVIYYLLKNIRNVLYVRKTFEKILNFSFLYIYFHFAYKISKKKRLFNNFVTT